MTDALGDRMKKRYEDRTRYYLPRRTYTILRLDGVAFHNYTRPFAKPYDIRLSETMDFVAQGLLNIQGAKFAYVQSDEISVLLTDFYVPGTEAWFDGNIQKMVSVAAATASVTFSNAIELFAQGVTFPVVHPLPIFDARVFTIADPVEVENYFVWRQKDAIRNSVSGLAQKYYSHSKLHGKHIEEQKKLIEMAGDDWEKQPERFKRGGLFYTGYNGAAPNFVSTKGRTTLTLLVPKIWAEDKAVE